MSLSAIVIVIHQVLFQGMFLVKNISLRRKLGLPNRGRNREAKQAILLLLLHILCSILISLLDSPVGTCDLVPGNVALAIALVLLAGSLYLGGATLVDLGDSWRVGVFEDQRTALVEDGIYRYSRNPYFLAYLIIFAAYSILLQSLIILLLSLVGFGLIHRMVLKEEKHLELMHGEIYRRYQMRVPRYILF